MILCLKVHKNCMHNNSLRSKLNLTLHKIEHKVWKNSASHPFIKTSCSTFILFFLSVRNNENLASLQKKNIKNSFWLFKIFACYNKKKQIIWLVPLSKRLHNESGWIWSPWLPPSLVDILKISVSSNQKYLIFNILFVNCIMFWLNLSSYRNQFAIVLFNEARVGLRISNTYVDSFIK